MALIKGCPNTNHLFFFKLKSFSNCNQMNFVLWTDMELCGWICIHICPCKNSVFTTFWSYFLYFLIYFLFLDRLDRLDRYLRTLKNIFQKFLSSEKHPPYPSNQSYPSVPFHPVPTPHHIPYHTPLRIYAGRHAAISPLFHHELFNFSELYQNFSTL